VTYKQAIEFLYGLQLFGSRPGLETTLALAGLCGNPHEKLRFIHVAGTNGKGSTCAMLESIYRASGLRVGLFTSPHLVAFGERIQVNREIIREGEVAGLVQQMRGLLERFPENFHPTFFEVITVMALNYFVRQECELVIWETGLGGRLDSTNIVTPLAGIITNIQFDHQSWLGDTLEKIAAEKAGIIKPGIPVITAAAEPGALQVLKRTAEKNNSPFFHVTMADTLRPPLSNVQLPLSGAHQRLNAATAIRAVDVLSPQLPVSESQLIAGLSKVNWSGRLQIHRRNDGGIVLLDGAHNIGGAAALRAALENQFPNARPTLILGILADKDLARICELLAPIAGRILLAPVSSRRSASTAELLTACRNANPHAEILETPDLAHALEISRADKFVVVAGSLYLIGEALALLKLAPATALEERSLNEWSGSPVAAKK
jgi:dihydrofolate synthase/folylpolyglutamate synthase